MVEATDDPVVNLDYGDDVAYSNLWKGVYFECPTRPCSISAERAGVQFYPPSIPAGHLSEDEQSSSRHG